MEKLKSEVLKTVKQWNTAFRQNDPATYFSYVDEKLSLFIPSSPYRIDGKSDDREEFEWSLKQGKTKVNFFQELQAKVEMLNETTALVTYHTRGVYGQEKETSMVYLKETNIWIKENGQWKIIHIHVSR